VVARGIVRPPEPCCDEIERARLLDLLDGTTAPPPLLLLAAPHGSGKSVLLAQWARRRAGRCAWVSLVGRRGASLVNLWTAVVAALREVDAGLDLPRLDDVASPDHFLDRVVPGLLNALANAEPPALVLDGLESVVDPRVRDSLSEFLMQTPDQLRVLMASNRPSSLPASLLRASGRLGLVPAEALRFTIPEAYSLMERTTRTDVDGSAVERLNGMLDGWALGLRIAGPSLGKIQTRQLPEAVLEYVRAEILERAATQVRRALLRCSVLADLRHEAVVSVAGAGAARALDSFAEASLMLERVPDGWVWHPVLRAASLAQLRRSEPELVAGLQTRAVHCAEGAWPAADPRGVVELVERLGPPDTHQLAPIGAAAALALGSDACADQLLLTAPETPGRSAVLALRALKAGDLVGAANLVRGVAQSTTEPPSWHEILADVVIGALDLWEDRAEQGVARLEEAALAAERCGYQDAQVRALDHIVACAERTGDADRARRAAVAVTELHAVAPQRSIEPVVAAAYLATTGCPDERESAARLRPSGRVAGPHALAFAAHLRSSAARRAGDLVGYRLAQAEGRAALRRDVAGPLLQALLGDQELIVAERLTARELVVLRALAGPLTLREIARELHVSHNTVKTQVTSLFRKLGVHDRAGATRVARSRHIVAG
jgi:LuxR family maltose regulon positive regulatory protein